MAKKKVATKKAKTWKVLKQITGWVETKRKPIDIVSVDHRTTAPSKDDPEGDDYSIVELDYISNVAFKDFKQKVRITVEVEE